MHIYIEEKVQSAELGYQSDTEDDTESTEKQKGINI